MKILGISCFYHDSACCVTVDGKIVFAAQEERYSRVKHDARFPTKAIENAINFSKIKISEFDAVVFYEKPLVKFERLLETYLNNFPKGFKSFLVSMPIWIKEKIFQKQVLCDELNKIDKNFKDSNKIFFSDHHLSHAASAFYPSIFDEALVLTIDAVGEWTTTSLYHGKGNTLQKIKNIDFPDSLGLLYSAFTYFLGFKVNSGEYKLMGLAPYGEPIYKDIIYKNLISIFPDGSFKLNQKYFDYQTGFKMINKNFYKLFEKKPRKENEKIDKKYMDIAASIQSVLEEIIINITSKIFKTYNIDNLCLAGGVALNCVANGKILTDNNNFKKIWIQPAAGDAGGALGAALAFYYDNKKNKRVLPNDGHLDNMEGSFLGQEYSNEEIKSILDQKNINYSYLEDKELIDLIAKKLDTGLAIGWFQGRMEFGPRALGNRSIIADPRSETMQKNLNLKVKFRESFRPFAPAVLEEDLSEWFETKTGNPYMLVVSNVHKNKLRKLDKIAEGFDKLNQNRSLISAVTHVDNSARVQTVSERTNKKFYKLIKKFKEITGVPILINTSFNIRGEPIVSSPQDAIRCFFGTNLDLLVCNNFIIEKNKNIKFQNSEYRSNFKLD
jgi:carbamoyltransferase